MCGLAARADRGGAFHHCGLTAELAARGIKTDRRAVWFFLHAEGMSFSRLLKSCH
jgi:transposase